MGAGNTAPYSHLLAFYHQQKNYYLSNKTFIMKNGVEFFTYMLGLIAVVIVLLGYPLMLLWNWLMPVIFGLPQITFWQAVGLNMLSSILFKSYNLSNKNNKE